MSVKDLASVVLGEDHSAAIKRDIQTRLAQIRKESAENCKGAALSLVRRKTGLLASTITAHEDGSVTAGGGQAWYGLIVELMYPFLRPAFDSEVDNFNRKCKEI